ncbi:hypothetical protein Hanom_Chr09g00784501 [Helianthus anomalus]
MLLIVWDSSSPTTLKSGMMSSGNWSRQNWRVSSSELFDTDDSILLSIDFPGDEAAKLPKLEDVSAAVGFPEDDRRANGTNSAASGFKLFALPVVVLSVLSMVEAPPLSRLIVLCSKKLK